MGKQEPKQKLLKVEHVSEAEITSLNGNLLNEFSIEELEARYETDPLMLSHLFGLTSDNHADISGCVCRKVDTGNCPELICICHGYEPSCQCEELCFIKCPELSCGAKK